MDHRFEIYRDDTMACMLADYVVWACKQGSLNYQMPVELRTLMQAEIRRLSEIVSAV